MGKTATVRLTQLLREYFQTLGVNPDKFAEYFGAWKALGAAGEFTDPYFGKDGTYEKPKHNGKMVLRHVHLPPEDPRERREWDKKAARESRKTSNSSLVYAEDKTHGYLLIYFAREPNGHSIAEMKTPESIKLMNEFLDVAVAFINNGTILM